MSIAQAPALHLGIKTRVNAATVLHVQLQSHSWEGNRISFVQYEEKAPGIWKYLWKNSEISVDTEKIKNYS
jgi:hypothetical protein